MNKKIILLFAGILLAATALGSSIGSTMEDPISVPIHGQNEGSPSGRPHIPARILFNGWHKHCCEALQVRFKEC